MKTELPNTESQSDMNELLMLANEYFSKGKESLKLEEHSVALDCFEKAKELYQKIGNHEETIKCLIQISSIQLHFGDLKIAVDSLEYAGELNKTIKNRILEADIYNNLGRVKLTKTEFVKSVEYINKSLVIYKDYKDDYKLHNSFSILGIAFSRLGKHEEAFQNFDKALSYFESIQDEKKIAENQHHLGSYYLNINQYSVALEYFSKALSYSKQINSIEKQARTLNNIGVIYLVAGELQLALKTCLECLSLFTSLQMIRDIANVADNLGCIYRELGQYNESLKYLFLANEKLLDLDVYNALAANFGNIGIVYRFLKDYNTSIQYLEKSIQICYDKDNQAEIGMYIGNLGITYQLKGEYKIALDYLFKAIAIYEKFNSKLEIAQFKANIGYVYGKLKEYEKSYNFLAQSREIFEELSRKEESTSMLDHIGRLYLQPEFKDYNPILGEQYLLEAKEQYEILGTKQHLCDLYKVISEVYESQHRISDSLEYYKKYHELYTEIQNENVKKQADLYHWENKLREMEKEKEVLKVKTEAEKQQLEKNLELQATKLDSAINELVSKNKVLNKVHQEVLQLASMSKADGLHLIDHISEIILRNTSPIENEHDFTNFIKETRTKLQSIQPDLSTMELKVCALLKMNLSTSNICSYLHLSKRTIESHRLSIRKKLQIPKHYDLHSFLQQIP